MLSMKSSITKEQAQSTLNLTEEILEEFGPRLTGTMACKKSGERLKLELDKYCTETFSEKFKCSRDAFLYFIRYFSISYLVAFIFLFIGGDWVYSAAVITCIGFMVAFFEFVLYWEFIDPIFKKVDAFNISGIIEPEKETKKTVIISGHYDSPYVFSFLNKWQKLYKIRVGLNTLLYIAITAISIASAWLQFNSHIEFYLPNYVLLILGIGVIFMTQYFTFIGWDISPGAGDNLVSSLMVVKLSEHFYNNIELGKPLKYTRLIFLCPDAEESGLRGAREYVKRHKVTLASMPSYNINMDSIYRLQDLRFLKSEINGTIKLDDKLGKKCMQISQSLGYNIPRIGMPFGGGSTDSGEFEKAGIPSVSIIGLDTNFTDGNVPYHTKFDTVDKIESKAVLACMQIVEQVILNIEKS